MHQLCEKGDKRRYRTLAREARLPPMIEKNRRFETSARPRARAHAPRAGASRRSQKFQTVMRVTLWLGCAVMALQSADSFSSPMSDGAEPVTRNAQPPLQSIRRWVSCDGRADDAMGAARAFEAARQGAFTLLVDCPVRIHTGSDIARSIFIDDGTQVRFTAAGRFILDNLLIPAFVIANSSHIVLTDWRIEYQASLPIDKVSGYTMRGRFVPGSAPPNAFNDLALTPWLETHRAIHFDRHQGNVNSRWSGATNLCAVFFVIGDVADLRVAGMHVEVPAEAGAERFVPVVFAFDPGYRSNQTVTAGLPLSARYFAVPHDLSFSDVTLDGTYMGWVGGVRDALFERITSHRYADLQDPVGAHVGGVGKWFAPPHLFYLSNPGESDPALINTHIEIRDVVDDGPRIGTARDKGGSDSLSGYALSLKIGCTDCLVQRYRTNRADGFLDVLPAENLTIADVQASYDSAFLNNVFPGWRFPSSPYRNVTFRNITFEDRAPRSTREPIGDAAQSSNEGIVFDHVIVTLNRWAGPKPLPLPTIGGARSVVDLTVHLREEKATIVEAQRGDSRAVLELRPATVRSGASTLVRWHAPGNDCSASGLIQGPLPPEGERRIQAPAPQDLAMALMCRKGSDSAVAQAELHVGP